MKGIATLLQKREILQAETNPGYSGNVKLGTSLSNFFVSESVLLFRYIINFNSNSKRTNFGKLTFLIYVN